MGENLVSLLDAALQLGWSDERIKNDLHPMPGEEKAKGPRSYQFSTDSFDPPLEPFQDVVSNQHQIHPRTRWCSRQPITLPIALMDILE